MFLTCLGKKTKTQLTALHTKSRGKQRLRCFSPAIINWPKNTKRNTIFHWNPSYLHKFHCYQFEPFLLKSLDDVSNKTTLDTIRLHHYEGSFGLIWFVFYLKIQPRSQIVSRYIDAEIIILLYIIIQRQMEEHRGLKSKSRCSCCR